VIISPEEIVSAVERLDDWEERNGKLARTYVFADFVEAIGFMMRVAIWAEQLNHHPEWHNVYRTVKVELVTHDVGGITEHDISLAAKMNELAKRS